MMEKKYIAPLTEIVHVNIGGILQEDEGTTDSTGQTNIFNTKESTFDENEDELESTSSLWDN